MLTWSGFPVLLMAAVLLPGSMSWAQAVVDPRALDALQPPQQQQRPAPARKPASRTTPPRTATTKGASAADQPAMATQHPQVTVRPVPGGPASPSPSLVPKTPPPPIVLPPPIVVPTRPATPPQPPQVVVNAPGEAVVLANGLRLTFGDLRSEMNPASETALRDLVRGRPGQPPPGDGATYTVTTYAGGSAEDPSTPRRLSLSRALSIRSVLMSQGVPSVQIYVKALGPGGDGFDDGPPDRADLVVTVPKAATAKP